MNTAKTLIEFIREYRAREQEAEIRMQTEQKRLEARVSELEAKRLLKEMGLSSLSGFVMQAIHYRNGEFILELHYDDDRQAFMYHAFVRYAERVSMDAAETALSNIPNSTSPPYWIAYLHGEKWGQYDTLIEALSVIAAPEDDGVADTAPGAAT